MNTETGGDILYRLNAGAGVGLLDIWMEFETTGNIAKKQRDLSDFTVVTSVEQLIRAIEEADGHSDNARDYLKVRCLNPK